MQTCRQALRTIVAAAVVLASAAALAEEPEPGSQQLAGSQQWAGSREWDGSQQWAGSQQWTGSQQWADSSQGAESQWEVAPFAGYRVGGGFTLVDTGQHLSLDDHLSLAVAFDWRADQNTQYELFYSRQSTTLGGAGFTSVGTVIEYLQMGGTVALDELGGVRPYFGGGLGVARLSPDLAAGHEETRFALSLSLGLRAPLSQHLALRLEARGFVTPINTDTAVFCRSDQGGALCRVRVQGSAFIQGDFLAGLAFTF